MFLSQDSFFVLALALALDGLIGDPVRLWTILPHPVVLMGRFIAFCDLRMNDPAQSVSRRRAQGVLALALFIGVAAGVGLCLQWLFHRLPLSWVLTALAASSLLAQRSLYDHIKAVWQAFADGGLAAGRSAVSQVVGRDTQGLDVAAVCRAAIESCAENFSDGVVAPAFWFALFGLPGLCAYKIVNTADSMIGHMTERHAAFGWASARCDDLLNLVPARLSALLILVAGRTSDAAHGLAITWRDARKHRSPNAGWPESAAAAALGIKLSGPRLYHGALTNEPWLNPEGRDATVDDIPRMLRLFVTACGTELAIYAALALFV